MMAAASGCHTIDNRRLPPVNVRIAFANQGDWVTYGVAGAASWRIFIRQDRIPANFPYTALTYTGFGGVLLVCDVMGTPVAYDLSCPVECKQDIRVAVNPVDNVAECPVCHSTYEVFTNLGHPLSGPAAEHGYGLEVYNVGPGPAGEYMLISR